MGTSARGNVIVVGGGIMGLAVAIELRRGGVSVTLLERRFPGAGSSGRSGAILRQHYSHETTVRMSGTGLARYGGHLERTGRDIGFIECGVVVIGLAEHRAGLERNAELMRSCGVEAETLDATDLRRLEPRGRYRDDCFAVFEPRAGFVDPVLTLAAYAAEAIDLGVELRAGVEVTELEFEDGQVRGVTVSTGERLHASTVVVAGGPWSRALLASAGIELPLETVRPEQAFFEPPATHGGRTPVFADLELGIYWKCETLTRTRVGRLQFDDDERVEDPDHMDEGVSDAFVREMRDQLTARLPSYNTGITWGGCGALYTITPDAQALIGPVPGHDGLWICTGFSGHGFKLAPAVGVGLAGSILGGDLGAFEPEFFALDRFGRTRRDDDRSHPFEIMG